MNITRLLKIGHAIGQIMRRGNLCLYSLSKMLRTTLSLSVRSSLLRYTKPNNLSNIPITLSEMTYSSLLSCFKLFLHPYLKPSFANLFSNDLRFFLFQQYLRYVRKERSRLLPEWLVGSSVLLALSQNILTLKVKSPSQGLSPLLTDQLIKIL